MVDPNALAKIYHDVLDESVTFARTRAGDHPEMEAYLRPLVSQRLAE
jgi:hypothetical protein